MGSRSSILCLMGLLGGMPCGSVNMFWYSLHSLFQRVLVFASFLCLVSPCVISVCVICAVELALPGVAADAFITAG